MTIGDIGGTGFDTLQLYAEMTGTEQDDRALETLNNDILAAVPGATPEEVGEAIDRIRAENPNWTMDQVFEAAIRELNPDCEAETINNIRSAWQAFTGVSGLSGDDIGEILTSPAAFVLNDENISEATVKNTLAILLLLMIEIAGEESANEMLAGCAQRDEILRLAKEKASDIRTKAVVSLAVGVTSAAIQIGMASMSMRNASQGLKASNASKTGTTQTQQTQTEAQALAAKAAAQNNLGQGISGACNSVGGLINGMMDADIALKDGESQVANVQREGAGQRKQKAGELIQSCLNLLQSMNQADYQTMTAIGRA